MRAVVLCFVLASVVGAQAPAGIQRGVVIAPESVTVGDPFRVAIRVRAPLGTVLDFPDGPDSSFKVEPLDRVVLAEAGDSTGVEVTATYRLAAWDVGKRSLRFPDILATNNGETRRVSVGGDLFVTVTSVLPADTALRVPRPARPVYEFGLPWWWWLAVMVSAAALGALLWWWWRRRPKARAPVADPWANAERAFARVDALGLVAAGETGQHVALYTDVVRDLLAAVRPVARTALTTSELLQALRTDRGFPVTRLAQVLHDADLVKFARRRIGTSQAVAHSANCRQLVEEARTTLVSNDTVRAAA